MVNKGWKKLNKKFLILETIIEHRLTLAMLITGLLRGRDGQLAKIAKNAVKPLLSKSAKNLPCFKD